MKNKIKFRLRQGTLDTIFPQQHVPSTSVSGNGMREGMSLARALDTFIADNPSVRAAQTNRIAAGNLGTSTVKSLYHYLNGLDFDAEILVGKRYLKQLVSPSPSIQILIEEMGQRNAAAYISHGVVRVNDLVLDVLFQKIGATYKQYNNFPLLEFEKYWMYVLDVNSLVEITPEHVKKLVDSAAKERVHQLPNKITITKPPVKVEDKSLIFIDRARKPSKH